MCVCMCVCVYVVVVALWFESEARWEHLCERVIEWEGRAKPLGALTPYGTCGSPRGDYVPRLFDPPSCKKVKPRKRVD
jgi:hypothetical protein